MNNSRLNTETVTVLNSIWKWANKNNISDGIIPRNPQKLLELTKLDLSNLQLVDIPKELCFLINIRDLHLYQNKLKELPDEIINLVNLENLFLSANNFSEIPCNIFQLTYLEQLGLSENNIDKIPSEVGNLINLRWLNLEENNITELPKEIGALKNLNSLFLAHNRLSSIPSEIDGLTNLVQLHLDYNELSELNPHIGNLTELAVIDLSNNLFTSLPKELDNLTKLEKIIFDNNPKNDSIKKTGSNSVKELESNKKNKKPIKEKKDINLFIKENVKDIGKDVYITPEIPEKKLNNAIKAFKCESFYESILAIYDDTLFGASDEGLVFTGEKMIFKEDNHESIVFEFSNISSVEYIRDVTVVNEREKIDEYTKIILNNEEIKLFKPTKGSFSHKKFAEFLHKIITEFEDYQEEDQLKIMSDMPDELKIAYLKIIINMTFVDDEEIDEKELAELFLLMTRLELDKESRFIVRTYITEISRENIQSIESLVEIIKNNSEVSHQQSLMISLAKDLINVYFSTKDTTDRDFKFLDDNQSLFELSDEEIDLAYDTVENDYKLLKEDLDDDTIKKNSKELASKAAAAGVPLAAVYISGSVVGMSAAGITSGLAALGMGMGMTGGLAVVGIIGILSYKGIQHLTGANELDKYKTRELMLHDVIKQTQKTISLIIDDVNYIVQKLNDAILNHSEQTEKIKKLTYMMAQFQGALKSVDNKSSIYQNSVNRLQSPKILDEERFKSLTEEPTKKPLYDFVISNYESKHVVIDNENVEKLCLKENVETDTLDKMSEIFKALGYFDMDNILTSKIKGFFG